MHLQKNLPGFFSPKPGPGRREAGLEKRLWSQACVLPTWLGDTPTPTSHPWSNSGV